MSLRYELRRKVRQLRAGASDVPGIAAVVGFKKAQVLIMTRVQSVSKWGTLRGG